MTDNVLETRNLSYSYEGRTNALEGVSVTIPRGRKTVFLGPNGAGKSTLFLHFNGINRPDSGTVLYEGRPIDYGRKGLSALRTDVSMVLQNPDDQIFNATVEDDVAFGPLNVGLPRDEVESRIEDALDLVSMTEFRERPIHQLSFGQKKRVAFAGALAMAPKVLIMDEPTAGLDPQMVHELYEIADELNQKGLSVVISTHDLETAYGWADEVRVMFGGRVIFSGDPDEFFENGDLAHRLGFCPPLPFRINHQMNLRAGVMDQPRPRNLVELMEKFQPVHKGSGRIFLAFTDHIRDMGRLEEGIAANVGQHVVHSGAFGSRARRAVVENGIYVCCHIQALEQAILEASLGRDSILYLDSSLERIVERRIQRFEQMFGREIPTLYIRQARSDY
jgi:cobalt/nickel transport system ATP-binding protein